MCVITYDESLLILVIPILILPFNTIIRDLKAFKKNDYGVAKTKIRTKLSFIPKYKNQET